MTDVNRMSRKEVQDIKQRLAKSGIDALMNLEVLDLCEAYLTLEAENVALKAALGKEKASAKRAIDGIIESNEKLFNKGVF